MISNKPSLSIIIPVYNVGQRLRKCVHSVLDQSLKNFELLLINDGSTDDSGKICDELGELDSRIQVIHKENRGVSHTRNIGLKNSKGKYIGWVDADDWIEQDMFLELITIAEKNDADMVWCKFYIEYPDRKLIDHQSAPENPIDYLYAILNQNIEGMLWNKVMKREIFVSNNLVFLEGANMAEDKNMLVKFLYHSKKIRFVNQVFYHYLQDNPISYTRDTDTLRIYEEIRNADDVIKFFEKHNFKVEQNYITKFQLHAKRRLLYSLRDTDILEWSKVFPGSNMSIFKNEKYLLRHKFLAICSIIKLKVFIKFWTSIKSKQSIV